MRQEDLMNAGILFDDCAYCDGKIYFITHKYGLLESFDMNSRRTSIEFVPEKMLDAERMTACKDTLFAISHSGNDLLIYDVKKREAKSIQVNLGKNDWGNIIDILEYHGKIVIFPRFKEYYWVYKPETEEQSTYNYRMMCEGIKRGVLVDDEYWIFTDTSCEVSIINMNSHEVRYYNLDNVVNGLIDVTFFEGCIYVLMRNGNQIRIDNSNPRGILVDMGLNTSFSKIIKTKTYTLLLPFVKTDKELLVNTSNDLSFFIDYPDDYVYEKNMEWSLYVGSTMVGDKRVFAQRMSNYMLTVDIVSGEISWMKVNLSSDSEIKRALGYRKTVSNVIVDENRDYQLKEYIAVIDEYYQSLN